MECANEREGDGELKILCPLSGTQMIILPELSVFYEILVCHR